MDTLLVVLLFTCAIMAEARPFPQPQISFSGAPVQGQPYSMKCACTRVCADPPYTLHGQWFKDSVQLPETSVVLSFPQVRKKDEGAYSCRIHGGSPETVSPESHLYHWVVMVPPQVLIKSITPDDVVKDTAGTYLILSCVVTEAFPSVPNDGYSWSYLPFLEGQPRPLVGNTNTLTLGPLTRKDIGQYFCQARNDQIFMRTYIPPGNTSFTLSMSCIDDLLRSDISSQAFLEKDRDGYRAWFEIAQYPGLILIQHPNTSVITNWHPPCHFDVTLPFRHRVSNTSCHPCKRTLSFSLSNVTKTDLGRYQCYVRTTHGTKRDSFSVELVSKAPGQVYIQPVTPGAVVKATAGKNLTLTCVVTEASPPVPQDGYSWSYLPSPKRRLRHLVGNTSTLTLGPLTREDSGQYFCQARNDPDNMWSHPPRSASVTVDVSCIDDLLRSDISSQALVEKDGDGYRAWFEIAQYPGLILIQHPNTSVITDWHPPCHFDVTLPFRHGVSNTSCDPCKKTLSFSLSNVIETDLGRYQCYVGTTHGTKRDSCSVELVSKVSPQVHIEPVTSDAVVKATAGKNLTLTCVVTEALPSVPKDGYSWSYLPSLQGKLRPLLGKTNTLTLGPLTREDSGQYFCQAWNDQNNRWKIPPGNASVTVNVSYLGRMTSTSDLQIQEGDRVILTCSVDSNPTARLAWVVDGQEVRHVTANVDHYVLERAACSDSKTYTCRASNPDLPGLERNTSTTLYINCGRNEAWHGQNGWLKMIASVAVVAVVLLVVIIIVVAVVLWHILRRTNTLLEEIRLQHQTDKLPDEDILLRVEKLLVEILQKQQKEKTPETDTRHQKEILVEKIRQEFQKQKTLGTGRQEEIREERQMVEHSDEDSEAASLTSMTEIRLQRKEDEHADEDELFKVDACSQERETDERSETDILHQTEILLKDIRQEFQREKPFGTDIQHKTESLLEDIRQEFQKEKTLGTEIRSPIQMSSMISDCDANRISSLTTKHKAQYRCHK